MRIAEVRWLRRCWVADFEDRGRGCTPRTASSIQKLEKGRKWTLPLSHQKQYDLANTLTVDVSRTVREYIRGVLSH